MLGRMKTHAKPLLICFVTLLAVPLFFFPALFQNSRSIQWDALDLHYPHLAFGSRTIQNGVIPLWEPHIYCGYPFIGYLQSGIFYPINFFISLFTIITPRIMILLIVFCYFSMALGMLALCRLLKLSMAGSAFSAIIWCFSGQLLGHATHLGIIQFFALYPWVLYLAGKGIHQKYFTFLSAALFGWAALAGHFQTAVYSIIYWLSWLVVIQPLNKQSKKTSLPSFLIVLLLALMLSISSTGIQLFATANQALQSSRQELSISLRESESFQPISLITLFRPNYFGGVIGPYSGPWDRTNQQCHVGYVTPFFWAVAVLYSVKTFLSRKKTQISSANYAAQFQGKFLLFLWVWSIVGFCYSLGPRTFVHRCLALIFPGWELVRTPAAILPLVYLSLSLLAGAGFDSFTSRLPKKTAKFLRVCIPLLTFIQLLALYWNSDLIFGKQAPYEHFNQTNHRDFLDARYAEGTSHFRIHEWDIRKTLLTNESSWKGWYQTGGRISGLHSRRLGELLRFSEFNKTIIDILRARYILVSEKPTDAFIVSTTTIPSGAAPWKPTEDLEKVSSGILFNPEARPYLIPIESWIVNTQENLAPELISKMDFNQVALLEEAPDLTIDHSPMNFDFSIATLQLHRLEFDYSLDKPALLVIGDTWSPDWKAFIDDAPVKILRANHALRAVVAPAGKQRLTMIFHPVGYVLGAFVALFSVSMTIALIVFSIKSSRQK